MKTVLAFSGSNSSTSINQRLVELAAQKFQSLEPTLIDLRDFVLPIYSVDIEEDTGIPSAAIQLRRLFDQHDAFMISSPEHNGMMPAFFKNTMDWLSRMEGPVFQEKPVMVMSTSPGSGGGATNLGNMEKVFPYWGASKVFAGFSLGGFHQNFDAATNTLSNPEEDQRLTSAVRAFEHHLLS